MPKPLILALLVSSIALAEKNWEPVTTEKNPDCETAKCIVQEGESKFELTLKTSTKRGLLLLEAIALQNLSTKSVQEFHLKEVNGIEGGQNDYFRIFKVSLRQGGFVELAVHAYNSARGGPMYYYFVFDPKKGSFVDNGDPLPKLKYEGKTKHFVSVLDGQVYNFKDLKFTAD
jgi:hypothetical protein